MKKILVTGGLGFIGSNFIRLLMQDGGFEKIINYDKLTYAGNPENLEDLEDHNSYEFVHADICDLKKVFEVFEEFQIDGVVNFAAESHVDRSIDGPEPFVQTNVVGTLRLLEAFVCCLTEELPPLRSRLPLLHRQVCSGFHWPRIWQWWDCLHPFALRQTVGIPNEVIRSRHNNTIPQPLPSILSPAFMDRLHT